MRERTIGQRLGGVTPTWWYVEGVAVDVLGNRIAFAWRVLAFGRSSASQEALREIEARVRMSTGAITGRNLRFVKGEAVTVRACEAPYTVYSALVGESGGSGNGNQ